jgi:hypothetical protein
VHVEQRTVSIERDRPDARCHGDSPCSDPEIRPGRRVCIRLIRCYGSGS